MSDRQKVVCPKCHSAFDEIAAREPMPAQYDPERCACRALLSFRYPDPTDPSGQRWVRQRVER